MWFVKVVHISVTGDTLFEELLVTKPKETRERKKERFVKSKAFVDRGDMLRH